MYSPKFWKNLVVMGELHACRAFDASIISKKFKFYFQSKLSGSPNFSRVRLLAMKKRNIKGTAIFFNESLNDADNSLYAQWFLMSLT